MLMQHIMKYIFVIIFVIFISKISSSKDLFETSFYEVEFISNNIEYEKIKKINEIKQQSILKVFQKTIDYENFNLLKISTSQVFIWCSFLYLGPRKKSPDAGAVLPAKLLSFLFRIS